MRKTRFLISIVLILCTVCQMCTVGIATNQIQKQALAGENAIVFLKAIGVFPELGDKSPLDIQKNISRGEVAEYVVRALGVENLGNESATFSDVSLYNERAEYISAAVTLGIMNGYGDGRFRPETPILYEELLKVVITALGYGEKAELDGGYPNGYILEAANLDIADNVKCKKGENVTLGDFATILVNALETPLLTVSGISAGEIHMSNSESQTLLKDRLGICKYSGVVKENRISYLSGAKRSYDSTAQIGEYVFSDFNALCDNYLGYPVTAYYTENNELVYISTERHNKVKVQAKNILFDDRDFTSERFVYFDDNRSKRSAEINPYADLIYNGVSVGSFDKNDMRIKQGFAELIDNNNDNKYDVIFINEYSDMVAGEIYSQGFSVVDANNSSISITLNPALTKEYICKTKKGDKNFSFEDIASGDVLSVFKSKNEEGIKLITVEISDKKIYGEYEAKGENLITVSSTDYDVSNYFYNEFSHLSFGTSGEYLLNFEGMLTAFGGTVENDERYGYLLYAESTGNGSNMETEFMLINETGRSEIISSAKRLVIDGTKYKNQKEQREFFQNGGMKENGSLRQLIRYTLDADGKIKNIETKNRKETEKDFSLDHSMKKRVYYTATSVLGDEKQDFIVDPMQSVVFIVPQNEQLKDNEDAYFVRRGDFFINGKEYNTEAYDLTEDLTARAIVVETNISNKVSYERAIIVDSIKHIIDPEGNDIIRIAGLREARDYIVRYVEDSKLVSNIKKGDIILMADDPRGYVVGIEKIISPYDELKRIDLGSSQGKIHSEFLGYYGLLHRKQNKNIVIGLDGSTEDISKLIPLEITNFRITIYDEEEGVIKSGNTDDLENYIYSRNPAARIFVAFNSAIGRDIFLFNLANAGEGQNFGTTNTYYLSPDGSDSASGKENSPWKTLAYASTKLSAGDMLVLEDGEYRENKVVRFTSGGKADAPIIIKARNKHKAKINFSEELCDERKILVNYGQDYICFENLEITQEVVSKSKTLDILLDIRGNYCSVIGNKIHHTFEEPLKSHKTTGLVVKNNEIYDSVHDLIDFVNVENAVVMGNILEETGRVMFLAKGGSRNIQFYNNVLRNTEKSASCAIEIGGSTDSYSGLGTSKNDYESYNIVAYNNIVYSEGKGSIEKGLHICGAKDSFVFNNTFYKTKYGVHFNSPAGIDKGWEWNPEVVNPQLYNNIFAECTGGAVLYSVKPRNLSSDYNLYFNSKNPPTEPNGVYKDPLFKDEGKDFRLLEGSPARKKGKEILPSLNGYNGAVLTLELTDFDGTERKTWSIGAYN